MEEGLGCRQVQPRESSLCPREANGDHRSHHLPVTGDAQVIRAWGIFSLEAHLGLLSHSVTTSWCSIIGSYNGMWAEVRLVTWFSAVYLTGID